MTEDPGDYPASSPLTGTHRSLYAEALRQRMAWGGHLSTLPGRRRMGDHELRGYIDAVLAARPGAHGNGEHLVALWLNRIVCTGPRWRRLWGERVSALVQRANAQASGEVVELHPLAEVVPIGPTRVVPESQSHTR